MYITAEGPHLRNDLYCVEWDVKLYYTIPIDLPQISWFTAAITKCAEVYCIYCHNSFGINQDLARIKLIGADSAGATGNFALVLSKELGQTSPNMVPYDMLGMVS